MSILQSATEWLDSHYRAGAKRLGASCNPMQRKLTLTADDERLVLDCPTWRETRMYHEMLHEHIGRLPERKE